ncbi:4Fe-4S binding protein [Tamlana sp. 2201CG12-4]|uniref:4Fe-4S binding protein n=1 Tax=Tamlana sp. 2201CG12-4 TaxID=3112582 RepID=UPI002DBC75A2|nr:4Fe-4S binding protein [Tamlana sp. 2201CG12-4]MEC3908533.1 4Fe-4S binding protein [Tamlana sp. 2201CG12-4]
MKTSSFSILTANQAVAQIAYKINEVFPIYPITPASDMSELVEQWHSENMTNAFDNATSVFQMQSESGVAGAMHGAIQTGSLVSTFTASQGLLLMLPNLYKIAGELLPNVIHVATRSIATHALSIFGDHSDIMAVRQSGYAMLGSASVQESHDLALISQAASLKSLIPFVHFFDGFRTSHEINKIQTIDNNIIHSLIDQNTIKKHKQRALTPNNPVIKGTSQGPDLFFQSREAINPFYDQCPEIVQNYMDLFGTLTGRFYKLFDYYGHPEAEHIIISMASSTDTIETTINELNKSGNKYGLIKVRLFRPFSTKHLIKVLPNSVKSIAVLDRTKEPGAPGEPLYLDVLQSISNAYQNKQTSTFPIVIGGRYGLSSKQFTPAMVQAIYNHLKQEHPRHNFTVGIKDDITHLSLDFSEDITMKNDFYEAIFYQGKTNNTASSFSNTLKLIGAKENTFIQGYTERNYKKSNTNNIAHLRISNTLIKAPYLIEQADFIGCQNANFTQNDEAIKKLKPKGTLLVNTSLTSKAFWQSLSANKQHEIINKNINVLIVNIEELKANQVLKTNTITELHACFLSLNSELLNDGSITDLNEFIYKVNTSIDNNTSAPSKTDSLYESTFFEKLLKNNGDTIPVSMIPVDGTYPTNTSIHNPVQISYTIPDWNTDLCTQCGACSMACPQAALRLKVYEDSYLNSTPKTFKSIKSKDFDLLNYTIQINPEQCNACHNCIDACPTDALKETNKNKVLNNEKDNWTYFESIPEFDRTQIDVNKISQQQLQEPLFKYSSGVEGCGEAPYLKLMSQLFGDRLLIANATGASSIFGGALPTTPWAKNINGHGPAWSNSLFEDNAEFGLGFRMSINQQERQAKILLKKLIPLLDSNLVQDILNAHQTTELEISQQRIRVERLKKYLEKTETPEAKRLLHIADNLIKKSVWIIGGDGWAYDIGYGGIDHVLASGENVNILVLDNEVYDNTGAQASKATPFGATAKFAFNGKQKQKKDLGLLAMTYDNVYVASVAIGADQEQTLKAFNEAESFDGPSIIIAYCHSESHGIDMKRPGKYHKAAVDSGQWLLYRNNPQKSNNNLSTLQLDSKVPSIKIKDYLKLENRFSKLFKNNPEQLSNVMHQIQKYTDKRFDKYLAMSLSNIPHRSKLLQDYKIKQQLTFRK